MIVTYNLIDGDDITGLLSKIISNGQFTDVYYDLIEQIAIFDTIANAQTAFSDQNNKERIKRNLQSAPILDTQNLIHDSLFTKQLLLLSTAIPTETYTTTQQNYAVQSARVNNATVNVTAQNATVIITNEDTDAGRDDFAETANTLNSVDVVIISIITHNATTTQVENVTPHNNVSDCHGDSDLNNSGTIINNQLSITIISDIQSNNATQTNVSNVYKLENNVTITFDNLLLDGINISNSDQICVWYNDTSDLWSSKGCMTIIDPNDENSVSCNCNHLTTFTMIAFLDDGVTAECKGGGSFTTDKFNLSEYTTELISFIAFWFLVILIFVCKKFWSLFKLHIFLSKYKERKESYKGLMFTGSSCMIHIIGCCGLLLYYGNISETANDVMFVQSLRLILAFPHLLYFFMFTQALHGWITVANSLDLSLLHKQERMKLYFTMANIFAALLFLLFVVILILDYLGYVDNISVFKVDVKGWNFNVSIYIIFELVWFVAMTTASICFAIYGCKIHQVLTKSLQMTRNANDKRDIKSQDAVIQRLTIISIILCLFFILQSLIAIYGIFSQMIQSIDYDFLVVIIDLYLNLMYLVSFLCLYVPQINGIIKFEKQLISSRVSKRTSTTGAGLNSPNYKRRKNTHSHISGTRTGNPNYFHYPRKPTLSFDPGRSMSHLNIATNAQAVGTDELDGVNNKNCNHNHNHNSNNSHHRANTGTSVFKLKPPGVDVSVTLETPKLCLFNNSSSKIVDINAYANQIMRQALSSSRLSANNVYNQSGNLNDNPIVHHKQQTSNNSCNGISRQMSETSTNNTVVYQNELERDPSETVQSKRDAARNRADSMASLNINIIQPTLTNDTSIISEFEPDTGISNQNNKHMNVMSIQPLASNSNSKNNYKYEMYNIIENVSIDRSSTTANGVTPLQLSPNLDTARESASGVAMDIHDHPNLSPQLALTLSRCRGSNGNGSHGHIRYRVRNQSQESRNVYESSDVDVDIGSSSVDIHVGHGDHDDDDDDGNEHSIDSENDYIDVNYNKIKSRSFTSATCTVLSSKVQETPQVTPQLTPQITPRMSLLEQTPPAPNMQTPDTENENENEVSNRESKFRYNIKYHDSKYPNCKNKICQKTGKIQFDVEQSENKYDNYDKNCHSARDKHTHEHGDEHGGAILKSNSATMNASNNTDHDELKISGYAALRIYSMTGDSTAPSGIDVDGSNDRSDNCSDGDDDVEQEGDHESRPDGDVHDNNSNNNNSNNVDNDNNDDNNNHIDLENIVDSNKLVEMFDGSGSDDENKRKNSKKYWD